MCISELRAKFQLENACSLIYVVKQNDPFFKEYSCSTAAQVQPANVTLHPAWGRPNDRYKSMLFWSSLNLLSVQLTKISFKRRLRVWKLFFDLKYHAIHFCFLLVVSLLSWAVSKSVQSLCVCPVSVPPCPFSFLSPTN